MDNSIKDDLVKELKIIYIDNKYNIKSNIFDENNEKEYVIPLYQRAYAWEDKEINQLIEDIMDVEDNYDYHIGSLIVSRRGNKYEVVDGQQRLTSLFLLLNCLGINVENKLKFDCRPKSNYTLENIKYLIMDDRSKFDLDKIDNGIQQGIRIIKERLNNNDINIEKFKIKLSHVIIYQIEVPENTDLNRYFEIMNTRGEQLEQHDILKAKLMGFLDRQIDKILFAKIWDACSDMTGYVQMHFQKEHRENIFGEQWNQLPSIKWDTYINNINNVGNDNKGYNIKDIIQKDYAENNDDGYNEDDMKVRFESIIEFPYFLLHTLKVFIKIKDITPSDKNKKLIDTLLDDKKLLDSFYSILDNGHINNTEINKEKFAQDFIIYLLRTRFLFDKYIIKREISNNTNGSWSLKSLYTSGSGSQKKPYYKNTFNNTDNINRTTIMLQSALRVSYTSPKVMHWITNLCIWLSKDNCSVDKDGFQFSCEIENVAKKAVNDNFFSVNQEDKYEMGVDTPHIVFNYLDFLLWKEAPGKYDDFEFEFRNSVEHWYPQHPSEGTFAEWKEGVDKFGNLCLIQRGINSRFSNMSPDAKKSTFSNTIEKGSIKLRLMSEKTTNSHDWKTTACAEHQAEMIDKLRKACKN